MSTSSTKANCYILFCKTDLRNNYEFRRLELIVQLLDLKINRDRM